MKVKVNLFCLKCGWCASLCPEVFQFEPLIDELMCSDEEVPEKLEESVRLCMEACPIGAIEEA